LDNSDTLDIIGNTLGVTGDTLDISLHAKYTDYYKRMIRMQFTWLYNFQTGYSILAQWKDAKQVYNIIFLNNFLLNYTKNTYNQRGISNVTCTTTSSPSYPQWWQRSYPQCTSQWLA